MAIRSLNQLPGFSSPIPPNIVASRRLPFDLTVHMYSLYPCFHTAHQDSKYTIYPCGGRGQRKSTSGTRTAHRTRHSGVPHSENDDLVHEPPAASGHFLPHGPISRPCLVSSLDLFDRRPSLTWSRRQMSFTVSDKSNFPAHRRSAGDSMWPPPVYFDVRRLQDYVLVAGSLLRSKLRPT